MCLCIFKIYFLIKSLKTKNKVTYQQKLIQITFVEIFQFKKDKKEVKLESFFIQRNRDSFFLQH